MNTSKTTHARIRIAGAATGFALAAALIAGCGSADSPADGSTSASPAPSSTMPADGHAGHGAAQSSAPSSAVADQKFNDADVMFVTMMYPHHAQAVEMADMVAGKDASADVTALAGEIRGAQQPEMDAFTRLLAAWHQPAPSATGHAMDGMMTPQQMDRLATLRGNEFDQEWLTMMIAHHEGAITMARDELAKGTNPEARKIAQDIVTSQQQEIDRMRPLLK